MGDTGLTAQEIAAVVPLLNRRLSLRIHGLELRYLIGKTVSSEGSDAGSLDSIRYQIEAIDAEISFIDQQLSAMLSDYSNRQGPWLVVPDDLSALWFVVPPPCTAPGEIAIAKVDASGWLVIGMVHDVFPAGIEVPSSCPPLRLAVGNLFQESRPVDLLLRVDGKLRRYPIPQ